MKAHCRKPRFPWKLNQKTREKCPGALVTTTAWVIGVELQK